MSKVLASAMATTLAVGTAAAAQDVPLIARAKLFGNPSRIGWSCRPTASG
ncbi:hypothetical protein AB5I41_20565 [Sphingomonas sp. MMS24-JH45]